MSALSSEFADARLKELIEECNGDYLVALAEEEGPEIQETIFDDLPGEVWTRIYGYNSYEVSNFGRVRSWRSRKGARATPKILNHYISPKGYHYVTLYGDNGESHDFRVHRLVANAFVDKEPGKDIVCHIDDNKDNNKASNLYWGTPLMNSVDSWSNNTYYHKSVFCYETKTIYRDVLEAADALGVCRSAISNCCCGKSSYVNHEFKYHVCYTSDMDEKLNNLDDWLLDKRVFRNRTVEAINIHTGEKIIFDSRATASRNLGIPMYAISRVLAGSRKHTHGWTFKDLSGEVKYA